MDCNSKKKINVFGRLLGFFGYATIALGVFFAAYYGSVYKTSQGEYNFKLFVIGAVSTTISGLLIWGAAEMIEVLHDCRNLLDEIKSKK